MNSDSFKTFGVVLLIGVALVGAIAGVTRLAMDDLLTEEQLQEAVEEQTEEIATADSEAAKQSKIKRLSKTLTKRKEKERRLQQETQAQLQETFNQLDPKQQAFWITVMLPERFDEWTQRFFEDNPDPEERSKKILQMVEGMKSGFDKLDKKELTNMRTGMETVQGKAYLQTVQGFFTSKLDSDKRSELEPVMREVLRQVGVLTKLPRPDKQAVEKAEQEVRAGGPEGRRRPPAEREVERAAKGGGKGGEGR